MIYNVQDNLPFGKLLLFAFQLVMSVFVATVLIANICGVAVSGVLVGVCLATIAYQIITKRQSPMFVSSSGAFVAPVIATLAMGGYMSVAIGGLVTCIIYIIFGLIFLKVPVDKIYTIFPKALIGAVTVVIGVNLMPFILTYVQINGVTNMWGVAIAFITMVAIAIVSHYSKGLWKILPFLVGTLIGYIIAAILTITNIYPIVDFSVFENLKLFQVPDFAFTHWSSLPPIEVIISVIILWAGYSVSAMMECLSDTAVLGNIIGIDLYKTPGLARVFIGQGVANLVGSSLGGVGICSYGEGVACVGFSKVASTQVTIVAALMIGALGFFAPVQAFIASIPSCVFAGAAMILYGFIASSGIQILSHIDWNVSKNLTLVSVVLTIGISGIVVGGSTISFSATALALIVGVILNIILKEKEEK